MSEVIVRCVTNEGNGDRNVITFESTYQENEEKSGEAQITLTLVDVDPEVDVGADFEVGKTYSVTLSPAALADDPFAKMAELKAEAAAIPNSTNTRGYKTPPELKRPPVVVPDGVVTEPRPSVVLGPVTDAPATAGVATEAGNPGPQTPEREGGPGPGPGPDKPAAGPTPTPAPTPAPRSR